MKKAHYGTTEDGREVDIYTLANDAGMRVDILTFGCVIARLEVPDRRGRIDNVVLGLDSLAGYALRSPHFGAIAGRYANRIARGRFAIDGKDYQLDHQRRAQRHAWRAQGLPQGRLAEARPAAASR